jgi:hypothetical protein
MGLKTSINKTYNAILNAQSADGSTKKPKFVGVKCD